MSCPSGLVAGCGCAVGLAFGFGVLVGRRQRAVPASPEEKETKEVKRSFDSTDSTYRPNLSRASRSDISTLIPNDQHLNENFVNDTLKHFWPHLKRTTEAVIRKEVEPDMQAELKGPLKKLHFTTVSLGREDYCPLRVTRMSSLLDERVSKEHGEFRCIRLLLGVEMDSECHVELKLSSVTAGVSHAKIRGSLVVELYRLLDDWPLFNGTRVYFADKPELDLQMNGGMSVFLNIGYLKALIIKVVLEEISQILVLPNRMVFPLEPEHERLGKEWDAVSHQNLSDAIKMKAPRPEGVLRLVLKDATGLNKILPSSGAPWYLSFVLGMHEWRSPTMRGKDEVSFERDHIVDFIVHDAQDQNLKVTLYPEIHDKVWGHYPGEALLTCTYRVITLTAGSVTSFCLTASEDDATAKSSESIRAGSIMACDENEGQEDFSDGFKAFFSAEWGKLTKNTAQATALLQGGSLFSGWHRFASQSGPHDKDTVALLLVGVRKASHLEHGTCPYWCAFTVSHVGAGSFDSQLDRDGCVHLTTKPMRGTRTAEKVDAGVQRVCASCRNVLMSDAAFCHKCGLEQECAGDHELQSSEIEATWDSTYFVPLYDPYSAKMEVSVHSEEGGLVGKVTHDIAPILVKKELSAEYVDILESGKGRDMSSVMMKPSLHVLLRIWVLEAGVCTDAGPDGMPTPRTVEHHPGLESFNGFKIPGAALAAKLGIDGCPAPTCIESMNCHNKSYCCAY